MSQSFDITGTVTISDDGTFTLAGRVGGTVPIPPPVPQQPVSGADQIDLSKALIVNAPDVRSWPATAAITGVSFDGAVSRIAFDKREGPSRWPDVFPPAFKDPINYTWWLFRQVNGHWVGSGFLLRWAGNDGDSSGSAADPDVPSVYHAHWFYASRWAPLFGSGPIAAGEQIGFMVTAGAARDNTGPYLVQERSNVVLFAATDRGAYTW